MKASLYILVFTLYAYLATAQSSIGPADAGMGGTYTLSTGVWPALANPAGLYTVEQLSAGAQHVNLYGLAGLSGQTLVIAGSLKKNRFGLHTQHFGNSRYRYTQTGFSFSRPLYPAWHAGIRLLLYRLHVPEYGIMTLPAAEAGFRYRIRNKQHIAFQVANPNASGKETALRELMPVRISLGYGAEVSEQVDFRFQAEKANGTPFHLRSGFSYRMYRQLEIRAGMSLPDPRLSFGIGIYFRKFRIDTASTYHGLLGHHTQIALSYGL